MNHQLTPELADLAIRFMARAQMSGDEANAYVAVRQALESFIAAGKEAPPWDVEPKVETAKEVPELAEK